jgi:hypothetical protein
VSGATGTHESDDSAQPSPSAVTTRSRVVSRSRATSDHAHTPTSPPPSSSADAPCAHNGAATGVERDGAALQAIIATAASSSTEASAAVSFTPVVATPAPPASVVADADSQTVPVLHAAPRLPDTVQSTSTVLDHVHTPTSLSLSTSADAPCARDDAATGVERDGAALQAIITPAASSSTEASAAVSPSPVTAKPAPPASAPDTSQPSQSTAARAVLPPSGRATRSMGTPAPINFFLLALPSQPAAVVAHFQRRFSASAVMCSCQRFPVYAQALGKPAVDAAFLNHLCLTCIHGLCLYSPDVPLWDVVWPESLEKYWMKFYFDFYSTKQDKAILARQPQTARLKLLDQTLARMEQWLLKKGWRRDRCDDPACTDLECISSVVRGKAGGQRSRMMLDSWYSL